MAAATGTVSTVGATSEHDRPLLGDDPVPFAPAITAAALPTPTLPERLLGWSQRWRFPLTLVFGLLIAVAAFSAYESKQAADPILTAPNDPEPAGDPRAGALSVGVGEVRWR